MHLSGARMVVLTASASGDDRSFTERALARARTRRPLLTRSASQRRDIVEAPSIRTESGAAISTASRGPGCDRILYTANVDGALDTAASSPMVHLDLQNTSNAGYLP